MMNTDIPSELREFTRVSCISDIALLKDSLRAEDVRDIYEIGTKNTPEEALMNGFRKSLKPVTFFRPDNPMDVIGMGGVVWPSCVWLLFHKDFFITHSDKAYFLKKCPMVRDWLINQTASGFMYNVTLKEHKKLRHWLRWLGMKELPSSTKDKIVFFYYQRS